MRRNLLLTTVLALALPLAAYADTYATYNFSGVQTSYGSTLTGSITFDLTSGSATSIDATYTAGSYFGGFVDTFNTEATPGDLGNQGTFFNDGYVIFVNSDSGGTSTVDGVQLALLLPYESLTGYPGSLTCAYNYGCNGVISTFYTDNTANYDPNAPEYSADSYQTITDAFCTGGLGATATAGGCTGGPDQPIIGAPGSATPEPSSLMLLGTGAIGLVGTARRRFRR